MDFRGSLLFTDAQNQRILVLALTPPYLEAKVVDVVDVTLSHEFRGAVWFRGNLYVTNNYQQLTFSEQL